MAAEMAGDRQLSLSGFAARRKARKAACTLLETETLPSVKNRALGKDLLCRVSYSAKNSLPTARLSVKERHLA